MLIFIFILFSFKPMVKRKKLLTIIFISAANLVGAQMMPVTTTIPTPYGNVQTTQWMQMGRPMYFGNFGPKSYKHDFVIILANDSVVTARTKINISEKQHVIKVKKGKVSLSYSPRQTKSISWFTPTGQRHIGIPADSCWLFESSKGKITTYSFLAEAGEDGVIAIKKGDGEIISLSKDTLEPMIEDNEKSLKFLKKNNPLKAIKIYNQE